MTAKIFRNSFLIGITVLLVSSVLFFAVMFSNYENQAFERLSAEAESISLALDRSGLSYLESLRASDRVTLIAPDGSVLFDNFADPAALPGHLAREEVQQALRTGTARTIMPCGFRTAVCCARPARKNRSFPWRFCCSRRFCGSSRWC